MKANLLEALPLFLGAVLGVWLYYSVLPFAAVLLGLGVIALVGWLAGCLARMLLPRYPVAAVYVWQVAVLIPVALIALGGYVSMWVIDSVPGWLTKIPLLEVPEPATEAAKEWTKTVSAALSTAITTFLGALILDDEKKSDGGLWPPTRIRVGLTDVFADRVDKLKEPFEQDEGESDEDYNARMQGLTKQLAEYESVSRALYSEEISIDLPKGWSLPGALARARIVRDLLKC